MLINCPRCGFQQPNDTFCARCGVDMETYKPAEIPGWKKILANPLIQLSLLVLTGGAVSLALFEQGKKQFAITTDINPSKPPKQLAQPEKIENEVTQTSTIVPAEDTTTRETAQVAAAAETSSTSAPTIGTTASNLATNPSPSTPQSPPTATATPASVIEETKPENTKSDTAQKTAQVVIIYAEIGQDTLNNLFSNSRSTGQFMEFNDYTAGLIPTLDKTIGSSQVKILHKEIRPIEKVKSFQWFNGIKDANDPNFEVGFTTFLTVNELENSALRGNMSIRRSWREPSAGGNFEVQKKTFPAEFEIDDNSGFFLSGVMPRRAYVENEQELENNDIFKILSSPQFKAGESNFIIFIDFQSGN